MPALDLYPADNMLLIRLPAAFEGMYLHMTRYMKDNIFSRSLYGMNVVCTLLLYIEVCSRAQ